MFSAQAFLAGNGMDVPSVGFVILAANLASLIHESLSEKYSTMNACQALLCLEPKVAKDGGLLS